MEKLFKDVLSLICNKFEFSFTIDANGGLLINYNEGAGSCKLMLDESQEGLNEFVTALNEHKNKKEGLIDILFFAVLGKAKKETAAAKDYKKSNKLFYYNSKTWQEEKFDFTSEWIKKASLYTSEKLPGLFFVKTGSAISILFEGHLIGAGSYYEKDALQACIEKITSVFTLDEVFEHLQYCLTRKFIESVCNKATADAKEAAIETKQTTEAKKKSKGYSITKDVVYFSITSFEVLDASKKNAVGTRRGRVVKVDAAPGLDLLIHDEINGSCVSLLFAGVLYEFDFEEGVDDFTSTELNAAVKKIERVGAEEILKMAAKDAPKVLAAA